MQEETKNNPYALIVCTDQKLLRILIYVNTDSGQYEHPAFPALGSVLF